MKKISIAGLFMLTTLFVFSQDIDKVINAQEVERIESFLSSDAMKGRKIFSPEIDKAAVFIAGEFKNAGLESPGNPGTYLQEFTLIQPKFVSAAGMMDGETVETKNIVVVTCQSELSVSDKSGYEKAKIAEGDNLFSKARGFVQEKKNLLVLVDPVFSSSFSRLTALKRGLFKSSQNVIFVLTAKEPAAYSFEAKHEITEQKLTNVTGILPGKSRKDECVIFSAHYDHIGTGKAVDGDSIYNGANDDAAGTTAVIMLAKYFKQLGNNERTIVFAAFTAEEVGGYGAQYFSKQFDPAKVSAMFNIEMIGTESKWGKNAAYITGFDKTDMGAILQKNLDGSAFAFYADPYPEQNLFYRSDNATLARLGVPAHTISTSKMDNEPNYHKVSDEVMTLDMENMAEIIKAIALSSKTIISGRDTPARVKVEELR